MCNTGSSHQLYKDVDKLRENKKLYSFEKASIHSLISNNLPEDVKDNSLIKWIYHNKIYDINYVSNCCELIMA